VGSAIGRHFLAAFIKASYRKIVNPTLSQNDTISQIEGAIITNFASIFAGNSRGYANQHADH